MCVLVALLRRIDQLCFFVCERERVYVCVRCLAAFCRDTTQEGQTMGVCMRERVREYMGWLRRVGFLKL